MLRQREQAPKPALLLGRKQSSVRSTKSAGRACLERGLAFLAGTMGTMGDRKGGGSKGQTQNGVLASRECKINHEAKMAAEQIRNSLEKDGRTDVSHKMP